jgi:hypothetical protein
LLFSLLNPAFCDRIHEEVAHSRKDIAQNGN